MSRIVKSIDTEVRKRTAERCRERGITEVTLAGTSIERDRTPGEFRFSGLTAGAYSLFVSGVATGFFTGYEGTMNFVPTAQVPEPGTLALFGLALTAFAFTAIRRRARV